MDKVKSQHYWKIHRRVADKLWSRLDHRTRFIIARDSGHSSREFLDFQWYVDNETKRIYEDESHWYNEIGSFKVSYYEPWYNQAAA